MSQTKKRPVTYGKSRSNPLNPQIPPLANTTRSPESRTSPAVEIEIEDQSSSSFIRSPSPARSWKATSVSSPTQDDDERNTMQRKRRKLTPEALRSHAPSLIKPHPSTDTSGRPENLTLRDDNDVLSRITRHDSHNKHYEARPQTPEKNVAPGTIPASRSSANRRPASQQKPSRRTRDYGHKNTIDSQDNLQRKYSGSPRKRLVDSLGSADEGSEVLTPMPDNAPEPEGAAVNVPESFPTSRSTNIKLHNPATHELEESQSSTAVVSSSMPRSSGVTYSRQRSFLNETLDFTASEPLSMERPDRFERPPKSHGPRTSRSPSEEDVHDSKPVRSIHELRQAGDNARFREVVDSVFEEIEDTYNSVSGKCCGLAELCGKLLDPGFVQRFCEQSFDERLANCSSSTFDSISATLMFSAYRLIISGGCASRVFSEIVWARILELASPLLDITDDLLVLTREPSAGLSKSAQASIRGIRSRLLPIVGSEFACLSPQTLALGCMKSALILLRQNGHTIRPLPTQFLEKLIGLMAENAPIGMDEVPAVAQTYLLESSFSVLENYSIISESFDRHHLRCLARLSQLYILLSLNQHDRSRQCAMSYVRVILNLTNKEPTICDAFAKPDLVSGLANIVTRGYPRITTGTSDKEDSALNEVILAIGTLINLAEETQRSRAVLKGSNARTTPFLTQFLKQFSDSVGSIDQAHSVPEVHKNVVAGYLSILLLTICLDDEARLLVKKSSTGDGLSWVLSIAGRFLQYHREVEKDTRVLEGLEQGESRLTARIEHIISRICQLEGSTRKP
ncbi:wings apart-like protein regulation of heterochromatin-domain-containing protein [Aspergillus unguis]